MTHSHIPIIAMKLRSLKKDAFAWDFPPKNAVQIAKAHTSCAPRKQLKALRLRVP